ncbi:PREDICTED: protein DOWNSTREAM OF FLC [Tarenaya hassleriana]|uniref:protein DOWNSTREAM OF FLC n=1 Tax=Tarenaya hassleriana TaxID=28532 RepID=UPI00053C7ED4|nr:PREDICTED: protein DOWNSTREAM OF FLC [Tarenaya hassleriana]
MAMARTVCSVVLFCAVSLLPLVAVADDSEFQIEGCVYCDTCRFGFETDASEYIPGATVKIECKDRVTLRSEEVAKAVTDKGGRYRVTVKGDRQDQQCLAKLVDSPMSGCQEQDPGRSSATVILTRSNGAASNRHFANAMGFLRSQPLPGCAALRKRYLADGDFKSI